MECRKLYGTVHSAKGLTNIRDILRTKAYAEISINGDSRTAEETSIDKKNECNPVWNSTVTQIIAENAVHEGASDEIVIALFCKRSMKWDGKLGEVKIPIWELLNQGASGRIVDHPVGGTASRSGTPAGGTLSFSYRFGETFTPPPEDPKPPRRYSSGWEAAAATIMAQVGIGAATSAFQDDN